MRFFESKWPAFLSVMILATSTLSVATASATSTATPNAPAFTPAVTVAPPANFDNYNQLTSVSCWSPGNCMAVGWQYDGESLEYPSYAIETSGQWSASQIIDSSSFSGLALGVSCWAANQCAVVGGGAGTTTAFGIIYNAGSWTNTLLSGLSGYSSPSLHSVSCRSDGSCVAVGLATSLTSGGNGIAATFSQGSWSALTPTSLPDSDGAYLYGVSCVNDAGCTAVGGYELGPLVMTASLGSAEFSNAQAVTDPTNNPVARLLSVSCTADGDCTAIGSVGTYGCNGAQLLGAATTKFACAATLHSNNFDFVNNITGFAVDESTGVWKSSVPITQNAAASGSGPTSVSCTSPGNCVEVGTTLVNNVDLGAFATETDGVWNTESLLVLPSSENYLYLNAVSCTQVGACTAVGRGSSGSIATSSPPNASPTTPTTTAVVVTATLAATGNNETLLLLGSLGLILASTSLLAWKRSRSPKPRVAR